jgi:hypothetical protein
MRKLFLLSVLVPCVAVLAGCPKKKTDDGDAGDAEAEAAVAVVDAAPAAPVAKNAAEIARFPAGEKPLPDDDQKTVDLFAQARTGPKQGPIVAQVKAWGARARPEPESLDDMLVYAALGVVLGGGLTGVWASAAVYVALSALIMGLKFAEGRWRSIEL